MQCSATAYAGSLAVALGLAQRLPVVAHVHGSLVGMQAGAKHTRMRRLLTGLVLRRAVRVVPVSEFIASALRQDDFAVARGARCLVRVASDKALRERLGAAGRRPAEECFNPGRVAAEFAAIYAAASERG